MRQSFIFKAFCLVLLISSSQFVFAQSSTKTTKTCQQSRTVEIDKSKDQQLSLNENDSHFDMSLRFKKEHTANVREMLTEELGRADFEKGKKQVWTSQKGAYTFELKEGYIYAKIIKEQLEEAEYEALKNVGNAALELAGFQVNLDGTKLKFDIHID